MSAYDITGFLRTAYRPFVYCVPSKHPLNTAYQKGGVSPSYLGTLWWRCVHAITGKFDIFIRISWRPHSAFSERCTNAVASPFGVTEALCIWRAVACAAGCGVTWWRVSGTLQLPRTSCARHWNGVTWLNHSMSSARHASRQLEVTQWYSVYMYLRLSLTDVHLWNVIAKQELIENVLLKVICYIQNSNINWEILLLENM